MNRKILGYGELMLRLSPQGHGNLIEQSDALHMSFAGAEANIIADLALLGHHTLFFTTFPGNPIGRKANQFLNSFGVNTDLISWKEGRLGTYYIEHGSSIRATRVTYDRENSLFSNTKISHKEWENALSAVEVLILTGITPALSEICMLNVKTALKVCKGRSIKVLFDLNFRRTLWKNDKAKQFFESILPDVAILCGNVGSAFDIFNIRTSEIEDYKSLEQATRQAADELGNYGEFEYIAMTMRLQENASKNRLGGFIKKEEKYAFSHAISIKIIDRLGGGDAFAAAVLHGILKKWELDKIVNFSAAAFAATQTIQGDINFLTEEEILSLANGNTRGFVKR
ncbi:sugar kinase [Flexithrix dorotheae]|uniref:sugar kinase n=1 Tax=Flexithrix dorotheae TaxID=70993 RepID=UPI0003784C04|nr:sugar kinase [Flexithrix dorotheae]